ncbi:Zn-dependent hydrolase [Rhizobium halophytocola]|uniref:N-carbamoyl-L-amino-acid hydrolase n=1 Tax=Rhizobium halophytocola TaxID=735519 RepID=A0ABS4DSW2_9HYPH|nr:Zn-dependent hydrolase [Rhizobium halophytocola]MBP1848786.1 N-carbamoyl-L-amino-acid hydrolase [Rhizobium halophytocola]
MTSKTAEINSARLKALLDGVNAFGANPATGGFNRPGFSDADMAVRDWLAGQMETDGLAVSRDQAGNLFGRLGPAEGACVMAGSHLDTVPEGGAFDGALGVAVALECARAIRDAGLALETPLVVVATSEEEGRFGGMLGSQTISGRVTPDWIRTAEDADGVRLADAVRAQDLDPSRLGEAAWPAGSIKAFLELHIEQGPVLESEGLPIGIVDAVSGVLVLGVTFRGTANHSGTTPMHLRADAFLGLAETGSAIRGVIDRVGSDQSRVTIGKVDLKPNFPHTIAGEAEFTMIIRDTSAKVMADLRGEIETAIRQAAMSHGLAFDIEERSHLPPMALDAGVRDAIVATATRLNLPHRIMPSGAGHDAQTMQAFCPAGLIFVPSRGGISHAPEEWTDWPHIEKGAELMLNTICRLTGAADRSL